LVEVTASSERWVTRHPSLVILRMYSIITLPRVVAWCTQRNCYHPLWTASQHLHHHSR
jgi:hypothetical protein